jgi:hypothetical protein
MQLSAQHAAQHAAQKPRIAIRHEIANFHARWSFVENNLRTGEGGDVQGCMNVFDVDVLDNKQERSME